MSASAVKSVILVDDNPDDLFIHGLVVRKSKLALEPKPFSNPVSALSYLAGNPSSEPRIILLDINMPYLDGFAFLERYGQTCAQQNKQDLIVVLTTSMHSTDKKRAEAHPLVRSYARKPLTVQGFEDLLDALLPATPNE